MSETLSEAEFERRADEELNRLLDALLEIGEDIDPDLQMGVLSIVFEDGVKYVINSHRAARQIWMAADKQAWHFDYQADEGRWVATQSSDELWSTLQAVLQRKLGDAVTLTA